MKNLSIFEPQIEKHHAYKKKTCNHQAYQEQLEKTIGMLKDVEDQWIIRQCEQLDNLSEKEKWNKIEPEKYQINTTNKIQN